MPFVSPATIAFGDSTEGVVFADLVYAHRQHHCIVEALERQESSRAEMLLREHATIQRHSMDL